MSEGVGSGLKDHHSRVVRFWKVQSHSDFTVPRFSLVVSHLRRLVRPAEDRRAEGISLVQNLANAKARIDIAVG